MNNYHILSNGIEHGSPNAEQLSQNRPASIKRHKPGHRAAHAGDDRGEQEVLSGIASIQRLLAFRAK